MADFMNLTVENLETEYLCCIIRTKTKHPGVEAKRKWLAERLEEGHVFRKLDVKGTVFIEYAPLEKAWVPVEGENYLYLYCLWVLGGISRQRLCQGIAGICHQRCQGKGKIWHLYAGGKEAESVAFRPILCQEIRLCVCGYHGKWL